MVLPQEEVVLLLQEAEAGSTSELTHMLGVAWILGDRELFLQYAF